jgi:hypothetical protein
MEQSDIPSRELGRITKYSREEIRISRDKFEGHDLINFRVYFKDKDGTQHPGRQGLAFKVALLPEVLLALQRAAALVAEGGAE